MKQSFVFLANGFEEVEALTVVDFMRRAAIDVKTVSITSEKNVKGAHGIEVKADLLLAEIDANQAEWLILPGGMPGASNLFECKQLCEMLVAHNAKGEKLAAICASPAVVFAPLGILDGKMGACYPGFEGAMANCVVEKSTVVTDGNVVTGNGPSAAGDFALQIISMTKGEDAANEVAKGLLLLE